MPAEDNSVRSGSSLDRLCIDTVRALSMDMVQRANSGHPGMPMAMAPVAHLLYSRYLKHNPADPEWPDRDRFILSAGHGSALLYSVLHLSGYQLSIDDLKEFRQWDSLTPGHPERIPGLHTPGVETTTGPLGQGFANGVGMAIAERFLSETYGSEIVDHRVYAICSDGDLMEGVSAEAASLAGHLKLGKLIYLYDDNDITIDGGTDLSFSEEVKGRFESYGWQVLTVADVNDLELLSAAIEQARDCEDKPSLIAVKSVIAYPSPAKQGTPGSHGAPLGEDEVQATKRVLGLDPQAQFAVPDEVYAACDRTQQGEQLQAQWQQRFDRWATEQPQLAEQWHDGLSTVAAEPLSKLPNFDDRVGEKIATRGASGQVIQALAEHYPTMLGGCADLAESVQTKIKAEQPFTAEHAGRNLYWGVREHAMASALNGIALHGGVKRPFGGTFLIFSDYMRPALRLSALMQLPVTWVFSHDSIGLGEDGPTHQPIEQLASLRAVPGLTVIRPADAAETVEAWRVSCEQMGGPACIVLSRQGLPVLAETANGGAEGLARGAYVISDAQHAKAVIVATGSEVSIALEAKQLLAAQDVPVRIVSMPSWELFARQDLLYRESVLTPGLPKLAVEAGVSFGWERWVDAVVGIDRYGASAPGGTLMQRYGFSADNVAQQVLFLLQAGRS